MAPGHPPAGSAQRHPSQFAGRRQGHHAGHITPGRSARGRGLHHADNRFTVRGEFTVGGVRVDDPCPPGTTVVLDNAAKLPAHDVSPSAVAGEDPPVVVDVGAQASLLLLQLAALERGEPAQRHVEYVGRLDIGEPEAGLQCRVGLGDVAAPANQGHDLFDVVEGNEEPDHDFQSLLGPAQAVAGAPHDHFETVNDVVLAKLAEPDGGGDAVDEHHVVDAEGLLQRREPVELG